MGQYKKFWYLLVAVLIGSFSILGYYGFEVYREAPPIPQQYVSESGEKVITHHDILHKVKYLTNYIGYYSVKIIPQTK